jgi:hypothetical protein
VDEEQASACAAERRVGASVLSSLVLVGVGIISGIRSNQISCSSD